MADTRLQLRGSKHLWVTGGIAVRAESWEKV